MHKYLAIIDFNDGIAHVANVFIIVSNIKLNNKQVYDKTKKLGNVFNIHETSIIDISEMDSDWSYFT